MPRKGRRRPKPGPRIPKDPRPGPVWGRKGGRPAPKGPVYEIPRPPSEPKDPWHTNPSLFGSEAGKPSFRGFGPR